MWIPGGKHFRGLMAAGALALLAAVLLWDRATQAQLTRSTDGQKVFEVKRVRPPYSMPGLKGIVPVGDQSGCYVAWSEKRVEVYRAGWTEGGLFDVAPIWGENFDGVRGVVALGDKSSAFVVFTKDSHTVYKADWFSAF